MTTGRNQSPAVFRLHDSRELQANKLGGTAMIDAFPEVPDDGSAIPTMRDGNEAYYAPDNDDIVTILRNIRDILRKPQQLAPFFVERIDDMPALANSELTIRATEEFRNIWVGNARRAMTVYAGIGRSLFLADLEVGDSLRAQLPFPVVGVTVAWTSAAQTDSLHVVLSSEPMIVEVNKAP